VSPAAGRIPNISCIFREIFAVDSLWLAWLPPILTRDHGNCVFNPARAGGRLQLRRKSMAAMNESKPVSFSVKMRPESKARVSSVLKEYASVKRITQAEALEFLVDTVESYGELPKITANAFNEFTAAVEGRLNALDLKMARILEEVAMISHVLQIAPSNEDDEPDYEIGAGDFEHEGKVPVVETRAPIQIKRGFRT